MSKSEDAIDSNYSVIKRSLLVAELIVLIYLIIDYVMHMIAYGLLFLKNLRSHVTLLFVLVNMVLLVFMFTNWDWSMDLFGTKMLFSLCLFQLKIHKTIQDAPLPSKLKQQVVPEENSNLLRTEKAK